MAAPDTFEFFTRQPAHAFYYYYHYDLSSSKTGRAGRTTAGTFTKQKAGQLSPTGFVHRERFQPTPNLYGTGAGLSASFRDAVSAESLAVLDCTVAVNVASCASVAPGVPIRTMASLTAVVSAACPALFALIASVSVSSAVIIKFNLSSIMSRRRMIRASDCEWASSRTA